MHGKPSYEELEQRIRFLEEELSRGTQADDALATSRVQLSDAMDLARIAYWTVDLATGDFIFNDPFYALYGTTAEREGGYRMAREEYAKRFVHPDDLGIFAEVAEKRKHNEEREFKYDVEHRIIRRDGEVRHILARLRVTKDAEGRVIDYYGANQDITDRKQAEEALRESESKFRGLAEKSLVGMYLLQGGLFRYVNAELAKMFGYEVDEIINRMGPKDVVYYEDYPAVEEKMRQRLSGELQSLRHEFRVKTKSGEVRHNEVYSSRTLYQGKPAIVGTALDITDRMKSEEELRRLSIAIEQAAEEIIITDSNWIIQYVNPAFESITGYSRSEAIGKTPGFLRSDVHKPDFYKELNDTINNGKVWQGRIVNRRKDGRLIHEDTTISPLVTSIGKLMGYVTLKRDITETVVLEAHLRQSHKMEAVGTLAGGIAHDFNNILSAILGYAELSKAKTKDSSIYPYLEQIIKAGLRSRDLVRQILTFSRRHDQEKKPVSVVPIVKEALKLLRSSIPATVEIRQRYNAPQDTILGDPTQIHQIVMNLCTNAVHAMRNKDAILEVTLGRHDVSAPFSTYGPDLKDGPYLQITVKDNGEGIDPAVKDKIFDPFFTTKGQGEGTGLGLSVVYGIVKDHGGGIAVESQTGAGTVFTIYLPLIVMDEKRPEEKSEFSPKGTGRILYVDDEEPIAAMAREWLASAGYDVTIRLGGHDALEAFQEHPEQYDLVVTDMTMPNMTGATLAMEILKVRPDLPIILTTGFSEQIDAEEAKRIGIREFLMKPFSLHDLARTIKKILDQRNAVA